MKIQEENEKKKKEEELGFEEESAAKGSRNVKNDIQGTTSLASSSAQRTDSVNVETHDGELEQVNRNYARTQIFNDSKPIQNEEGLDYQNQNRASLGVESAGLA